MMSCLHEWLAVDVFIFLRFFLSPWRLSWFSYAVGRTQNKHTQKHTYINTHMRASITHIIIGQLSTIQPGLEHIALCFPCMHSSRKTHTHTQNASTTARFVLTVAWNICYICYKYTTSKEHISRWQLCCVIGCSSALFADSEAKIRHVRIHDPNQTETLPLITAQRSMFSIRSMVGIVS